MTAMITRGFRRALATISVAAFVFVSPAQTATPAQEFAGVSKLYYNAAAKGLSSFHCDIDFDWKNFLVQSNGGKQIPDDLPVLKYLQTVRLSVDDSLKGAGDLRWNVSGEPPEGKASAVDQIHSGMSQAWHGFLQAWNQFMNGYMVTVTDDKTAVEKNAQGFHLIAKDGENVAEEQFGDNSLLLSMHVHTAQLDIMMKPAYTDTPQGRIIRNLDSDVKTASGAMQITMAVDYQAVSSFQLPSKVKMVVPNAGSFQFGLSGCSVGSTSQP